MNDGDNDADDNDNDYDDNSNNKECDRIINCIDMKSASAKTAIPFLLDMHVNARAPIVNYSVARCVHMHET